MRERTLMPRGVRSARWHADVPIGLQHRLSTLSSHRRQAVRYFRRHAGPRTHMPLSGWRHSVQTLSDWYHRQHHGVVASGANIVHAMRSNPKSVAYNDLLKVCDHYFGQPRQGGTSHAVFTMPRAGDPRVNIQNDKGESKAHQVRQVLAAIDKKEAM